MDRSLIVIDDRNASEQRSRQLPYEVNLEPVELLFAASTIILAIDSHVGDVFCLLDVPECLIGDGDAPLLLDQLYSFPECQMLILDEELLAGNVLDLLLSELPAAIIRLNLLVRDTFYYISSLILLQKLVDGALRPTDHCRNLWN